MGALVHEKSCQSVKSELDLFALTSTQTSLEHGPVAYLGFPAPGDKLSFGATTQPVHGSVDAKNELGIKGRRKLTRALQSPAYSSFSIHLKTSCDCDVTELTSRPLNLGNH